MLFIVFIVRFVKNVEKWFCWFTDLGHMFVFAFTSDLQLINLPFIPGNVEPFCSLPNAQWRKVLVKFKPENSSFNVSQSLTLLWNQRTCTVLIWCLAFFLPFLFLIRRWASDKVMENNYNPDSESTDLPYINIDRNLACFLCLQCFRGFYCSPVSLLRQYLWVGRSVCSTVWTQNNYEWLCSWFYLCLFPFWKSLSIIWLNGPISFPLLLLLIPQCN